MKKTLKFAEFLTAMILTLSIISCTTVPLDVPQNYREAVKPINGNQKMEFIGWKASADNLSTTTVVVTTANNKNSFTQRASITTSEFDSWKQFKNDPVISGFGNKLETSGIAIDKSFAYFGIYSLQELELYKSDYRYITFIQVNKNRLTGESKDSRAIGGVVSSTILGCGLIYTVLGASLSSSDNPDDADTGGALVGVGIGFDIAGLIGYMITAGIKVNTKVSYDGDFDIFIYDTQEKKILRRENVTVSEHDTVFTGFYEEKDFPKVANYFSVQVYNAILKKYVELGNWLAWLEKSGEDASSSVETTTPNDAIEATSELETENSENP